MLVMAGQPHGNDVVYKCVVGHLRAHLAPAAFVHSPVRRPGDVSFSRWANNRGLAIDVAVICPTAVHEADPCENYARLHKHARYDEGFQSFDYDFVAMVFETTGGINDEGKDVLRQILRCASKQSKMGHSSYCARAWSRISSCIQISVAQMILNRETDDSIGLGVRGGVDEM